MKNDSVDQQADILDTPEQKKFNDFSRQNKEEQKNINTSLFKEIFNYDTPDKMLQTLRNLNKVDSYNQEAFSIEDIVMDFRNKVKQMSEGVDKNKGKEISKIVSNILDSCLNERNQRRKGLKLLTPN